MFVSFGLRFRAEVEALNMAESVGNYARHRTAPVVIKDGDKYRITLAPAVSGQSIAHGYMAALVQLAQERGLPLSDDDKKYEEYGGFLKRAYDFNLDVEERIRTSVVEDITGFMTTKEEGKGESKEDDEEKKPPAKRRTSPVMFSYLVPDTSSAKAVLVPQLHVRYNIKETSEQRLYQVESGSGIYIQAVAVDVDRIGLIGNGKYVGDVCKRIELAFDALKLLYSGMLFGAKKARYLPIFEPLGGVAIVSPKPFMVLPPRLGDYVAENLARLKALGYGKLFCFDREGITSCGKTEGAEAVGTLEELIDKTKQATLDGRCVTS